MHGQISGCDGAEYRSYENAIMWHFILVFWYPSPFKNFSESISGIRTILLLRKLLNTLISVYVHKEQQKSLQVFMKESLK